MSFFMSFRVGDTYPNQMLQVQVRAYFYRWKPHTSLEGEEWPFTAWELKITDGLMSANQLLLRMPTTMVHVIDDDSPLAAWCTGRAAVATDSDSEIVVMVSNSGSSMLNLLLRCFAHQCVTLRCLTTYIGTGLCVISTARAFRLLICTSF